GVRGGQLAFGKIKGVLQTDSHITAKQGAHRHERHLMATGRQHGQVIVIAKQLVGNFAHVQQVVMVRAHTPQNAEDALQEERRLDETSVCKMRHVVQMAEVVTLKLKARPSGGKLRHTALDLREGVGEDEVLCHVQIGLLPVE